MASINNEGFLHKISPQIWKKNFKAHQKQECSKQAMALLLQGPFLQELKIPGFPGLKNPSGSRPSRDVAPPNPPKGAVAP